MSALAGKRLLIMHGTHIAAEIVRQAQRMGITAVVADYHPVEKAPAKAIADEHYEVSLLDVEAVVDLVREQAIDGVVAGFSDLLLPYYAQVCERAGLPAYGTEAQFRMLTDKRAYRALFEKHGVPVIPAYSLDAFAPGSTVEVEYPVIVKPAEGSGSRGITICHSAGEVLEAASHANDTFFGEGVVIERYLDGQEATAFWVFQDGEAHLSALANRHVTQYNHGSTPLPFAYTMPSAHLPRYEEDVTAGMREAFADIGIRNGMMFVQGKIDRGTFRAYDVGFRLTGTQEYWLISRLSGYNPLEMLIRFALTGSMGEEDLALKASAHTDEYAFNVSIAMRPGTVGSFTGLDEIEALPETVSLLKARNEGDTLLPEREGQLVQIAIRVLGVASSTQHMLETMTHIRERIRVLSPEGADLTLDISDRIESGAVL